MWTSIFNLQVALRRRGTTNMAKFRIVAELYIEGEDIKKERDAWDAVREMLGAYDDMTETTTDTMINIQMLKTEEI
jgi:hypothetical protein